MGLTKIREAQVVDAEFSSEEETSLSIETHRTSWAHGPNPISGDEGKYLRWNGSSIVWDVAVPGEGENGLPPQIGNGGKFLSTNGTTAIWADPTPLGWKDNIVALSAGNSGNPDYVPIYMDSGNGIWGFSFSDTIKNYAYCDFHVNHDYLQNSPIYPHIHWMPLSTSTGVVRWIIEYTVAKGHNQNEILTGAPQQIILEVSAKGVVGEHMVTEASDLQTINSVSEADAVVRCRVYRDAAHPNDTFYGSVMGIMVDFHYQSSFETTLNKSPNFYGSV